jgi:glycosyltransferase involved in cell wall biosynthesis
VVLCAALGIAISSDTKRRTQDHYGIARGIDVVNYGFRPPATPVPPPTPAPNGAYRLVAVGRLVARKGFADLLEALARLPKDIRLTIVGDGPLAHDLSRRAEAAGVTDRVTWAGYEPRERIYTHLAAADCYVLSSLHEGMGIVVQEAMYAGLPIVATDNGGQVDLIRPGENGLLVPIADPAALATAIDRLYRDRARGRAMGERNRRAIALWFAARKAEEYVTIFREAVAAHAATR